MRERGMDGERSRGGERDRDMGRGDRDGRERDNRDARDGRDRDGKGGKNSKQYAFVELPGNAVKKRPRRRYDEIERLYRCR